MMKHAVYIRKHFFEKLRKNENVHCINKIKADIAGPYSHRMQSNTYLRLQRPDQSL